MALRAAKIQPTLKEKRYITLQFLEAAFMSGNRVIITPVDTMMLTSLSEEQFTYSDPIETYIIYTERPSVSLLKSHGWYREDQENVPQVAQIPTHLLYRKYGWDTGITIALVEPELPIDGDIWFDINSKVLHSYLNNEWTEQEIETEEYDPESIGELYYNLINNKLHTSKVGGRVVNEVLLNGSEMSALIENGESDQYVMQPLTIKRGTMIDVFFDFAPEQAGPEAEEDYYFKMDHSTTKNRFYVVVPHIDTVSINYVCKLMAYKYDAAKEAEESQNPSNGEYLKINFDDFTA